MGILENKQLPALHASLGDFKRSSADEQTASGEGDEITVAVSVNTKIINKHGPVRSFVFEAYHDV